VSPELHDIGANITEAECRFIEPALNLGWGFGVGDEAPEIGIEERPINPNGAHPTSAKVLPGAGPGPCLALDAPPGWEIAELAATAALGDQQPAICQQPLKCPMDRPAAERWVIAQHIGLTEGNPVRVRGREPPAHDKGIECDGERVVIELVKQPLGNPDIVAVWGRVEQCAIPGGVRSIANRHGDLTLAVFGTA
jgi:hypothetical protein